MIPVAFDYQKAVSIEEAVAALSGGENKLLAGGYSLLPSMKLRLNSPSKLIDISSIPSLKGIREDNGHIIINAGTTHYDIGANEIINHHLPFFREAVGMIGDVQVRNRGTIGGSIAHADPAADWPALIIAADATIETLGSGGSRSIKATDFFTGLFSTGLKDDEIITSIRVPIPAPGSKMVYLKFSNPASRFAIVGCAVLRLPDGKTNIGFTGISEHAFRDNAAENAIFGGGFDAPAVDAAVNAAAESVNILGDNYASEAYRKHLAKVFLRKALKAVA